MRYFWMTPLFVCLAQGQALSLQDALDQAGRQNPAVQIARLRMLEQQAGETALKAAYKPQVNISVGGAYQTSNLQGIGLVFPGFSNRLGPFRTFNARPTVTQTVLDFSLLASIRAARAESAATKLDIDAAREETQAAIVEVFLRTFQAQSQLRAAKARVASADALLAQVTQREQGGASIAARRRAQSAAAAIRATRRHRRRAGPSFAAPRARRTAGPTRHCGAGRANARDAIRQRHPSRHPRTRAPHRSRAA